MKIVNKTHYRTRDLRRFAVRVAREELRKEHAKHVQVTFSYTRRKRAYSSGNATIGGYRCTARLNKDPQLLDKGDLAFLLRHEFGHLKGLTHKDMGNRYRRNTSYYRSDREWAAKLPLEVQPPKGKRSTAQRRDARLTAAQNAVVRWERKAKLASTKLKLWQRKVRGLERTLDKAAQVPRKES